MGWIAYLSLGEWRRAEWVVKGSERLEEKEASSSVYREVGQEITTIGKLGLTL